MEKEPQSAGRRVGSDHREGPAGEVWRDGPCLLTVPSEWKDEVPALEHNVQTQGLNCTGQIPLFRTDRFQYHNIPTSRCSWLPAITTCPIFPLIRGNTASPSLSAPDHYAPHAQNLRSKAGAMGRTPPAWAHPPAQPWPCPGPTRRRAWCHPAESSCSGSEQSPQPWRSRCRSRGAGTVS